MALICSLHYAESSIGLFLPLSVERAPRICVPHAWDSERSIISATDTEWRHTHAQSKRFQRAGAIRADILETPSYCQIQAIATQSSCSLTPLEASWTRRTSRLKRRYSPLFTKKQKSCTLSSYEIHTTSSTSVLD